MEYRRLGSSALAVSCLSLGSWLTYEFMSEAAALAVIQEALNAGVNFLDDARYDDRTGHAPLKTGYSEVVFGRLLKQVSQPRERLVIANKFWYEFYPQQTAAQELDRSLERLQLDYLDLAYCAPPPAGLAVSEMVEQMDELVRSGKLRAWGVLNWGIEYIHAACAYAQRNGLFLPCAAQLPYSLLQRSPVEEETVQELFREQQISVVASYSLYGGLLTGKYRGKGGGQRGRLESQLSELEQKGLPEKADLVVAFAAELGCTPAQLALAYCLQNDLVASVLFGATSLAQLRDNLGALDIASRLDEATMQRLRELTETAQK